MLGPRQGLLKRVQISGRNWQGNAWYFLRQPTPGFCQLICSSLLYRGHGDPVGTLTVVVWQLSSATGSDLQKFLKSGKEINWQVKFKKIWWKYQSNLRKISAPSVARSKREVTGNDRKWPEVNVLPVDIFSLSVYFRSLKRISTLPGARNRGKPRNWQNICTAAKNTEELVQNCIALSRHRLKCLDSRMRWKMDTSSSMWKERLEATELSVWLRLIGDGIPPEQGK